MRRFLGVLLVVTVVAGACGGDSRTGQRGAGSDEETGPIKIGVVGPMTGLAAFVGKNMVEGIQLAVDDLNGSGGLLGRQVEFVIRDDEYDPAKTTTVTRELIENEDVAALFGPASTNGYLSIARILEDNKVPAWVIMAGPELTDTINPYAFRAYLPDRVLVDALAQYAAQNYSRIAIVAGNDAEGESFVEVTREVLSRYNTAPVAVELFSQDETDFSPIILKVKQANPDAVIMGTHLGLFAARAAVAAKNLGLDAQLLGLAGLINYTYPDLARDAADDTIFVSFRSWAHVARDQWPASVREFYERYVDKYLADGEFSATGAYKAYSTNFLTYDMVMIWAHAVREAGGADPEKVADVLNGDFQYPAEESVIGVPWRYTADDHDGIKPEDLIFYTWDLQPDKKFRLTPHGTTTEVLSGEVQL